MIKMKKLLEEKVDISDISYNHQKLLRVGSDYIQKARGGRLWYELEDDINKFIIDPKYKIKIVGIRPGEKIHEVLWPGSTSHLTLDFKDHLILLPTVDLNKNYLINKKKERGKIVKDSFVYSSDKNKKFLSVKEIKEIIKKNDPLQ